MGNRRRNRVLDENTAPASDGGTLAASRSWSGAVRAYFRSGVVFAATMALVRVAITCAVALLLGVLMSGYAIPYIDIYLGYAASVTAANTLADLLAVWGFPVLFAVLFLCGLCLLVVGAVWRATGNVFARWVSVRKAHLAARH